MNKHLKQKKRVAGINKPEDLVDMSDEDFQSMLTSANMTALLNIKQYLDLLYSRTVIIKDNVIEGIIKDRIDPQEGNKSVRDMHVLLLIIEKRYKDTDILIGQRMKGVEERTEILKGLAD